MVTVPADTPVTIAVLEFIVATAGLLLVQAPPHVALPNEVVLPVQTIGYPVMGVGKAVLGALTVTICVAVAVPQLLVTV